MADYVTIGRPGAIGSRKKDVEANYENLYGNYKFLWKINDIKVGRDGALRLYEDAYFEYFKKNKDELLWIANNFENVYDNHISNVNSGLDYDIQEYGGNHFQDIAIRKVLVRNNMWFKGKGLLEIRMKGVGKKWSPGEIPFHIQEIIPKPELKGFWKPGSIESWYQSAKYLEAEYLKEELRQTLENYDIIFVTSNKGKVESAKKGLNNSIKIVNLKLDISEEQETVEQVAKHKARAGYNILCRPVICDDSGFNIKSMGGYPSSRVARILKEKGLEHFLEIARKNPRGYEEAEFVNTLSYMDETLDKPKLFTSIVRGRLI